MTSSIGEAKDTFTWPWPTENEPLLLPRDPAAPRFPRTSWFSHDHIDHPDDLSPYMSVSRIYWAAREASIAWLTAGDKRTGFDLFKLAVLDRCMELFLTRVSLAKADSSNTERREANSRTFESMDNRPGTFREWQRITDGMILTAYNDAIDALPSRLRLLAPSFEATSAFARHAMDLVYDGGDLDAVQDSLSITRAPWSELSLGEFTKCTVTNPPPRLISTEGHGEDVEKGWAWDDEIWNHVDIQPFIPPPALLASWKDREASRIEGC